MHFSRLKYFLLYLFALLLACDVDKLEVFSIPISSQSKEFKVMENDKAREYGSLRFKSNNGYTLNRTAYVRLPSTPGAITAVVTIIGAYSEEGNEICFKNQMVFQVKFYNRWGEEIEPAPKDVELLRQQYDTRDTFTARQEGDVLVKN